MVIVPKYHQMISIVFDVPFHHRHHRSRAAQAANELVLSDKAKDRVHALEQKMAVK